MLKHVVMFKMLASLDPEAKQAAKAEVKTQLLTLPAQIEELRAIEVGLNILESERSFDVVLISEFDNQADLATYAQHPAHQAVLVYIRSVCGNIVATDYEY
ncbi:MAG: hypothetical protein RIS47_268 [Bacteroidota bacterium]|jgi:DTW domain-containing protein YfiP